MKAPAISSVTPGSVALNGLERVKGIEPSYAAWEAAVLPLNYTRKKRQSYCQEMMSSEEVVFAGFR